MPALTGMGWRTYSSRGQESTNHPLGTPPQEAQTGVWRESCQSCDAIAPLD
jgi:hypothetical protein